MKDHNTKAKPAKKKIRMHVFNNPDGTYRASTKDGGTTIILDPRLSELRTYTRPNLPFSSALNGPSVKTFSSGRKAAQEFIKIAGLR